MPKVSPHLKELRRAGNNDLLERLFKLFRVFAGPYFFAHGFEALVALGVDERRMAGALRFTGSCQFWRRVRKIDNGSGKPRIRTFERLGKSSELPHGQQLRV